MCMPTLTCPAVLIRRTQHTVWPQCTPHSQHGTTCCNTLQHAATHCNMLQHGTRSKPNHGGVSSAAEVAVVGAARPTRCDLRVGVSH
jgi:hypothetical protein